jgi:hypothetical protein
MRRAGIDSGSRWLGLVIADDATGPHPLSYVYGDALTVGREVPRATPKLVQPKPKTLPDGSIVTPEPYYLTTTREVTEEDESAVASEVMMLLVAHGVEAVEIEKVDRVYAGKGVSVQGAVAQGTNLGRTKGVYTRIAERCAARGIAVEYVLAVSWRARLAPMVKAEAAMRAAREGRPSPEGSTIKRRGDGLDPALRLGIAAWPDAGTFHKDKVEHICDAAGILLARKAPPLLSKRAARAATSPRGPRKPREKRTAPRGDRVRGKMGALDLAKYRATDRARYARKAAALLAEREAAGCACRKPGESRRGRHKKTCPKHVSKAGARALQLERFRAESTASRK